MAKLTNVSCEYTGGGVYVFTALLNGDVWLMTDFLTYDSFGCYDAPLDVVESDFLPDGHINYDGHWKNPSAPLPQWLDIIIAVKENCGDDMADEIYKRLPANAFCRIGEKDLPYDAHSERLETLCSIIEVFENFLDEKGIVIPNDEKEQSPDSASNIYGTDYGILSDRLEELLIRLGYMKEEV